MVRSVVDVCGIPAGVDTSLLAVREVWRSAAHGCEEQQQAES
jgi:hypothetical protein